MSLCSQSADTGFSASDILSEGDSMSALVLQDSRAFADIFRTTRESGVPLAITAYMPETVLRSPFVIASTNVEKGRQCCDCSFWKEKKSLSYAWKRKTR